MVSPVVPLLMTPLLTPFPRPAREAPLALSLLRLGEAGEIEASPVVVVAPVLAFCASTTEADKTNAAQAITISFIFRFSHPCHFAFSRAFLVDAASISQQENFRPAI
jgi:hypothetical protein